MQKPQFKTKRHFIHELGLSKSTFYRLVKKKNIAIVPDLLSPDDQNNIRIQLGFPPLPVSEIKGGTD